MGLSIATRAAVVLSAGTGLHARLTVSVESGGFTIDRKQLAIGTYLAARSKLP